MPKKHKQKQAAATVTEAFLAANANNEERDATPTATMIEKADRKLKKRASKAYAQANGAMDIDVPVPSPWQTTTNGTQTDLQASQSASQGKKSRKRKRHSEHAAAGPSQPAVVNGNGHISGEEVDELASPAKTPPSDLSGLTQAHANVSVNGSPPKKKRKKQKNRQSEAAESSQASNVVKAPVPVPRPEQNSRPDSEANAAAAIVEEPPVIVNAAQEAEAVAAARRARKAEKKRRKAEKAAAALAAAQKAGGPAEAKSDNGNQAADIPVPQLNGGQEEPFMEDAEAALAAAAGRNQVNRDVVLANAVEATNEAPATSSSKKSSRKDKKSKKDKKGKGKAKEAATAVPLFQPEEDENKNDEERDELAEDSDAIPELPPPLKRTSNMPTSASRRAVSFVDVDENGAEVTQEEAEAEIDEDEAIDPVLRSPSKKQKKADKRKSKKNKTNAANPNSDTEENPNLGAASSSTSDIAASGSGRTLRQRTARNYQPPASPSASPQPAPFLLNSSAPAVHPMPVDGAKPLGPSSNTQENRDLLATKWMTAKQMAEIPGLVYKSGQFSPDEDAALLAAINDFKEANELDEAAFSAVVLHKGKRSELVQSFWHSLAVAVVDRPLHSIYARVKRMFSPDARKGAWSADEDAALSNAVAQLGEKWEAVSARVGRWASDCRDRYRNYVRPGATRRVGLWTEEEEDNLRDAMSEIKETLGLAEDDDDSETFWTAVATKLGGTRTRAQCRIKWQDNLKHRTVDMDGKRRRFGKMDGFILVNKLRAHMNADGVERYSDIDWKALTDETWKMWSVHVLQKRFRPMHERALRGLGDPNATFPQVIAYLSKEQQGTSRNKLQNFMDSQSSVHKAESDIDSQEERVDEENSPPPQSQQSKASSSITTPATKGRGRPAKAKPPSTVAPVTPAKASKAKGKGKARQKSPSPPVAGPSGTSNNRRSTRLPTARAIVASVPEPPSKYRTKEFITDSDDE